MTRPGRPDPMRCGDHAMNGLLVAALVAFGLAAPADTPWAGSAREPHAPGTQERVWLELGAGAATAASHAPWASLNVPLVRQPRERCGQAALTMVLRYYGAAPAALREVEGAYDPVIRGSRIGDLAGAARRAGYEAIVATLTPDSLIELLNQGVPPILLYPGGTGPAAPGHFAVVTAWDATEAVFTLNDGTERRIVTPQHDLAKRWVTSGSQALIVRERVP